MTFVMYQSLNFVLYADDTTFYNTYNDIDILFSSTNIELERLYNWLCINKLPLNVDKSKYVILKNKNKRELLFKYKQQ